MQIALDEAARVFSETIPNLKQAKASPEEFEKVVISACDLVDQASDAFERHIREHKC